MSGLCWQCCKEVSHGQRVIEISESVNECWISAQDAGHHCLMRKAHSSEQAAQTMVQPTLVKSTAKD